MIKVSLTDQIVTVSKSTNKHYMSEMRQSLRDRMLTVEIEQENNQVETVPLLNQGKLYAKLIEAVNEILTQISSNQ